MLQTEFEEFMGHPVTVDEYHRANFVYENSELDKDEFCNRLRKDPLALAMEMCGKYVKVSKSCSQLKLEKSELEDKLLEALKVLYAEALKYSVEVSKKELLSQIRKIGGIKEYVNVILADKLEEDDLEFVMSKFD